MESRNIPGRGPAPSFRFDRSESGRGGRGRARNNNQSTNWRIRENENDQPNQRRPYNSDGPNHRWRSSSDRPNPRGQRQRFVGFRYIQDLVNKDDLESVVLELSNGKAVFTELLESDRLSDDLIILVMKLMSRVCDVPFANSKVMVLQTVLQTSFIDKLIKFIAEIVSQTAAEKSLNNYLWTDPDEFWQNIIKVSKEVHDLIPSVACDVIRKMLLALQINLPHIAEKHKIQISDKIKTSVNSLLEVVEKTAANLEHKRRGADCNEFEEPPDDFRQIPVVPTVVELTTYEKPYYRPNVVDKPYDSVEHYLDVQFRLLREDFVAPLRKGICNFIHNAKNNIREKIQDIRIYRRVRFLWIETVTDQNCFRIQYDFSNKKRTFRYENSRRFMYGSLICFTRDRFGTLIFGKIVQRDEKLLEKGQLIVGFNEDVIIDFDADYLMVESSVFFEPYYQVLNVLKKMVAENFPMEKYIIKVEKDTNPPSYLLDTYVSEDDFDDQYKLPLNNAVIMYEVEGERFSPLKFPENSFYGLNESQSKAFKAALSQEFCIIQGPPGTGKTYLGLKIVHTLLKNFKAWYTRTPILVICYTNRALDQFLEGLLPVTKELLRIGGQSKNETLNRYNLKNQKNYISPAVGHKYHEVKQCITFIKVISESLQRIEEHQSIEDFWVFVDVVPDFKQTSFYKRGIDFKKWLLGGRDSRNMDERENAAGQLLEHFHYMKLDRDEQELKDEEAVNAVNDRPEDIDDSRDKHVEIDDIFDEVDIKIDPPLTSLSDVKENIISCYNQLQDLQKQPNSKKRILAEERRYMDIYELQEQYKYFQDRLAQANDFPRKAPYSADLQDPHNITAHDRWQLYFYWLHLYTNSLKSKRDRWIMKFKRDYKVYNDLRDMDNIQVMRDNLVVGMTTTGAARLQSSLQSLKCPIVIVEEAAEILEAHIVAALTNHCQHLILIGDHLQLRPSTASYNIETFDKLGISMFERMVINKVQCYTLDVQHRMRPEISRLICPTIYPHLKDHESTLNRPHILGVENDLYFIDHQELETECQDTSKKNEHEANFLICLARYLILNGYQPENITIIAAYLGQFYEIQREKKKHLLIMDGIRIAVLDNYQGDENEIVLLSLVRSNAENKIGFLKTENRVCVALSRARNGLYIIGNMTHLCENSEIWPKIRTTLSEQNALGTHLTLSCQVHHTITRVSKADDFSNVLEGGCNLPCEAVISCGHVCTRVCHTHDRDHSKYNCNEECNRLPCNDPEHICKKKCYEVCGPCTYLVEHDLKCGHKANIYCHKNPDEHHCDVLLSTKLPCDHVADKECDSDPITFRCPHLCDTRVEPCGHACTKLCHIRFDPDHLQYNCSKECEKPRMGCMDPKNPDHKCSMMCFQICEECNIGVKKYRSCGHVETVKCKLDIEKIKCQKPCKRTLSCGHKCKSKCFEECGPCLLVVKKIVPDCNHSIQIPCFEEPNRLYCQGKCTRLLPCGHKCTKKCFQECTTSKCNEKADCNIQSPCGHILKTIQCHLKDTTDPEILLRNCTEPCGEKLKCGDICMGTCRDCFQGRIHKRCEKKCGRILVCNHECPLPCRQACRPCQKPCEYKCNHSKCKKICGEPCSKCMERCPRKCKHQKCRKRCGELCNVAPCKEKCTKKLGCGHICVGFCGDLCPKFCKICDADKLQEEIFLFGTEDEETAIFVELRDCGHILESSGLEYWFNQNSNVVQSKLCPRCKAPILTTERFSHYVKLAMKDVVTVKKKEFGALRVNDVLKKDLLKELDGISEAYEYLRKAFPDLNRALHSLTVRLLPARKGRRQPINNIELNAIKCKIQILSYIIRCFHESENVGGFIRSIFDSKKRETSEILAQLSFLLKVIMQDENAITTQEVEDIEFEINRLERMVQLEQLKEAYEIVLSKESEILNLLSNTEHLINKKEKFTEEVEKTIQMNLEELNNKIDIKALKFEREKREIVAAIKLTPGHWFKCPNGHYYAIGECGGAMEVGKCPDCGATVGGQHHRLLSDNRFAPEMDNARAPAWPGVH